ncbi:MAG: beta-ketoacyl-[acyl-carrier-protein] synthase II [Proteobacteria bacterium]|nr:MAG: beta-ketoacyl-[acyl-carrier-protein] synthase II [Pseudomonadota bacterium]
MRRVVVTGLGLVTPLACGVEETWKRLIAGQSGAARITKFDPTNFTAQVACEVKKGDGSNGTFNADQWLEPKEQRRVDEFIVYGIAAASQAIQDSGWEAKSDEDREMAGVLIGSGIGGLPGIEKEAVNLFQNGPRRVSPFFIPGRLINLVSGQVSIKFGLKGPNHSVVTACATGAHAIGDAARFIALGDADMMVAGGSEAAICPVGVAGFAQAKALSTGYNDRPTEASRPWDKGRDGFVIGEGAGVVVLEEYERAKKRGAKIYAEVKGYGLSGDAFHVTSPEPTGDGAFRAMRAALKRAEVDVSEVHYINAHGTSTPMGDEIEAGAVQRLFGNALADVSMSSTKSAIGHLLGAAGSTEAIFCILAMRDGVVPPTLNLHDPAVDPEVFDLVPLKAKERKVDVALSNSFGFGGTNASLVLTKV